MTKCCLTMNTTARMAGLQRCPRKFKHLLSTRCTFCFLDIPSAWKILSFQCDPCLQETLSQGTSRHSISVLCLHKMTFFQCCLRKVWHFFNVVYVKYGIFSALCLNKVWSYFNMPFCLFWVWMLRKSGLQALTLLSVMSSWCDELRLSLSVIIMFSLSVISCSL